jgi:hypothetical protein
MTNSTNSTIHPIRQLVIYSSVLYGKFSVPTGSTHLRVQQGTVDFFKVNDKTIDIWQNPSWRLFHTFKQSEEMIGITLIKIPEESNEITIDVSGKRVFESKISTDKNSENNIDEIERKSIDSDKFLNRRFSRKAFIVFNVVISMILIFFGLLGLFIHLTQMK